MDGEWTLADNVLTWRRKDGQQRVFVFNELAVPVLWVEFDQKTDAAIIVEDAKQITLLEEQLKLLRGN